MRDAPAQPEQQPERFTLILIDEHRDRAKSPAAIRVRQLLKIALRGFGLRCVEVKEQQAEARS